MSPKRPVALPDADKAAVRRHLVAAAARVIARRRTANITVREIATEADVASGLLYNHFADKDDLVAAALLERGPGVDEDDRSLAGLAGQSTVEDNLFEFAVRTFAVMRDVLPIVFSASPAMRARVAAAFNRGGSPQLVAQAIVSDYLNAEMRLGRIRADADTDTAAVLLWGALHGAAVTDTLGVPPAGDPESLRRIVRGVVASVS